MIETSGCKSIYQSYSQGFELGAGSEHSELEGVPLKVVFSPTLLF